MATNNSWNNQISAANSSITLNSGTNSINVSTDASATTVSVATGGAAKSVTIGSTNSSSSLALRYGTSDFTLASGTGTVMSALDTGEITYPLQPAFYAYPSGDLSNVTGNGTDYTVANNSELYDQNSDYNTTTYTFTAPVTGKYLFGYGLYVGSLAVGNTLGIVSIVFTTGTLLEDYSNIGIRPASNGVLVISDSHVFPMTAGDTALLKFRVDGGTQIVDLSANGAGFGTRFWGQLIC